MAETASKLLAVGVRIIGGCCGTTPTHLAAMSRAVKAA
jgi:homocysteine S-methyltransferase